MAFMPRIITLEAERRRLEELAHKQGYPSLADMLYQLYIVQDISIEKIAREILFTSLWTLRKRFDELQIPMQTRGGKNWSKVEITPELVAECTRNGVPATAERLGLEPARLYVRLNEWAKRNKGAQ